MPAHADVRQAGGLVDPWVLVAGLVGLVTTGLLNWLRETWAQRREAGARSEERARLEGELVVTLKIQGEQLGRIERRLDGLPCGTCPTGGDSG